MHYVVGDIHGHSRALDAILNIVELAPPAQLTFLGDYVDCGPDTRGVLDRLMALDPNITTMLFGNHELMLLHSIANAAVEQEWLQCGGGATLQSFGVDSVRDIPDKYIDWLYRCRNYQETAEYVFVHAGADPAIAMSEQSYENLFWKHVVSPIQLSSGKTLVCGHTPRAELCKTLGFLGIDTGIARGGWLSCVELTSQTYWQADASGSLRSGRFIPFLEKQSA